MTYKELQLVDLQRQLEQGIILIVTATELETNATHKKLSPLPDFESIIKVFEGNYTYYFGKFGNYFVAHVQCGMGSISRDSSIMTVSTAIKILKPKFVLMIGIAFGVDDKKQNIGDVLISEAILPYNFKRVGKEETIHRSIDAPASKLLLSRFKSIKTWEYLLDDEKIAKMFFCHILSGEELIDNSQHRDTLVQSFPTAKGGEMEGVGLYSACDGSVDWILVKGICDFADGKKGVDKAKNQEIAIDSALSLCLELFSSHYAFQEYGIKKINAFNPVDLSPVGNPEELLFDVYDLKKEKFYINRNTDNEFMSALAQYSIWVHGISGCGKTNLILRNLIFHEIEYVQITLAGCIGLSVDEIFKEILYSLKSIMSYKKVNTNLNSFNEIVSEILNVLKGGYSSKNLIVFIEEIPISEGKEYSDFVQKIFSLMITKLLIKELGSIKFVLSSINSPTPSIPSFQLKIHQQMKFINMNNWSDEEINELIDLISFNLKISLSDILKKELKKTSKRSPRFIKKYFRNILACNAFNETLQRNLIDETSRELN